MLSKDHRLVAFICHKSLGDPKFGAVKLNKVLYHIDGVAFLKYGKPISTFDYIKQENGPTPKPSAFLTIRNQLEEKGILQIQENESFGFILQKPVCLDEVDISDFEPEEIEIIDKVIEGLANYNGTELSHDSHGPAWKAAAPKEVMPIYTYLTRSETPSYDEVEFALKSI